MARTTQTRIVEGTPAAVFDLLAAFERTAEWDPGVSSAERLDPGPVAVGTRFRVVARFLGQSVPMTYQVVRHQPPHALELEGEASASRAHDVIVLRPVGDGATEVTWSLTLRGRGPMRLADPFLGPVLRRLGRAALDGLQAHCTGRSE